MKESSYSHNPCFSGILFAIKSAEDYFKEIFPSQSLFQWNTLCNRKAGLSAQVVHGSQSLFQWNTLCNLEIDSNYIFENLSQSLFQWNTLCNIAIEGIYEICFLVTILVLVEYSLQWLNVMKLKKFHMVTILVLVEYSLQFLPTKNIHRTLFCHNPCFSGILFAIDEGDIEYRKKFLSQSLFQWNTLCNLGTVTDFELDKKSQSLFQWNTLCNTNIRPR